MIGRFFLGLIVIASLSWIGYVGLDILNVKSNFSETQIFSYEDGKVLVVNRPEEVRFDLVYDFQSSPFYSQIKGFNLKEYETAFISFKRSQILLKRNDNWTQENIKSLFSSNEISFNGSGFKIGEIEGEFFKTNLYVSQGEFKRDKLSGLEIYFDKKSSASVIEITENNKVKSVADLYFMAEDTEEGEVIRFKTIDESILQGKK